MLNLKPRTIINIQHFEIACFSGVFDLDNERALCLFQGSLFGDWCWEQHIVHVSILLIEDNNILNLLVAFPGRHNIWWSDNSGKRVPSYQVRS